MERPAMATRRGLLPLAVGLALLIAMLYVVVPGIAGLEDTWERLALGDPAWLVAALVFEILSYLCYMALVHGVFGEVSRLIDWRVSYRVTMAGVVASRLFALAGVGGIAVTAWALSRYGIGGRAIAARMAAMFIFLYGTFMAGMVVAGIGLWSGLLPGPAPAGLTLVPAVFGATVIAAVLAIALLADDLDLALDHRRGSGAPIADRIRGAAAAVPATVSSGAGEALALIRARRWGVLGGPGWFVFDIAVLWAALAAFGATPAAAAIVMSYLVGMSASALPVPGGIGVVEGGIAGALIAFGVEPGAALVGVLTYRALAFWLPMVPGAFAYLGLLRSTGEGRTGAGASGPG
jgi:uncharacterized membrane protein YbhN (UPF0104 family)